MKDLRIELVLEKLSQSKFRSQFHLKPQDLEYIDKKTLTVIEQHAYEFVEKRLAPANIPNDGKQTPMKGHPVFIAQHATATCCRNCLYKWHHIPKQVELTSNQKEYIVNLIMKWINMNLNNCVKSEEKNEK